MKYFLIILFSTYSFQSFGQFQWVNPLPQGNSLNDCCVITDNIAFACGYNGTIIKTNDAGENWTILNSGTSSNLNSISFSDTLNGIAVGEDGIIIRTIDGGDSWTQLNSIVTVDLFAVILNDSVHGIIFGEQTILTTSNGVDWIASNCTSCPPLSDIYSVNPLHLYSFGPFIPMYESFDGGYNWIISYRTTTSISFINNSIGYLVQGRDTIYKTINSGASWILQTITSADFYAICFLSEDTGFACTSVGLQKTTDGGITWNYITYLNSQSYIDNLKKHGPFILGSGYAGGMIKSTDEGATWESCNSMFIMEQVFAISFENDSTGYITFQNGQIIKTDDAGNTWDSLSSGINWHIYEIATLGKDTAIASSYSGQFIRTTDGGVNWTLIQSPTTFDLVAMCFPTHSIGYALVWTGGGLLKTIDGGLTWSIISTQVTASYWDTEILFTSETVGYITGEFNIWKTTDGGLNWTAYYLGGNEISRGIYFVSQDIGYIVGNNSHIWKTIDGGISWIELYTDLTMNTQNYDVFFTSQNVGYVANEDGIIKTFDGGLTWTNISKPPYSAKIVYFTSTERGYAISGGGIFKTINGGGSPVGITETPLRETLEVYPNPSNTSFTLSSKIPMRGSFVQIFNVMGEMLLNKPIVAQNEVITNSFPSGLYFVKVATPNGDFSTKIIVQKQ